MPWTDLKPGGLDAYFGTEGADRDALWVFVHVPKTAGSALGGQLAAGRTPSHNVTINYTDPATPYATRWTQAVDGFLAADAEQRHRFVTGHHLIRHVDRLRAARPDLRLATLLRDPVDRVISNYRYCTTPKHPTHVEFTATYPTLEHFVEHRANQNAMTRQLLPFRPAYVGEAILWIETRYSFVGTVEDLSKSLHILGRLVEVGLDPGRRINVTDAAAVERTPVTAAMRSRIAAVNDDDVALYEHFRARLASIEGPGADVPKGDSHAGIDAV